MRTKLTAGLFGVTLAVVLVLSAGTATAGTRPSTSVAVKQVTLTNASNGSTVLATKGELVVVKLSGGHLRWSTATVDQSTPVLVEVSAASTSTGGSVTVFRVVNYGLAGLTATGTPICAAAACPQFVVLWHATVTVPVVDPPVPPVA